MTPPRPCNAQGSAEQVDAACRFDGTSASDEAGTSTSAALQASSPQDARTAPLEPAVDLPPPALQRLSSVGASEPWAQDDPLPALAPTGRRGQQPSSPAPPLPKRCANCGTSDTPMWRRDKELHMAMCNACGIYFKNHGVHRPMQLIANPKSAGRPASSMLSKGHRAVAGDPTSCGQGVAEHVAARRSTRTRRARRWGAADDTDNDEESPCPPGTQPLTSSPAR